MGGYREFKIKKEEKTGSREAKRACKRRKIKYLLSFEIEGPPYSSHHHEDKAS